MLWYIPLATDKQTTRGSICPKQPADLYPKLSNTGNRSSSENLALFCLCLRRTGWSDPPFFSLLYSASESAMLNVIWISAYSSHKSVKSVRQLYARATDAHFRIQWLHIRVEKGFVLEGQDRRRKTLAPVIISVSKSQHGEHYYLSIIQRRYSISWRIQIAVTMDSVWGNNKVDMQVDRSSNFFFIIHRILIKCNTLGLANNALHNPFGICISAKSESRAMCRLGARRECTQLF